MTCCFIQWTYSVVAADCNSLQIIFIRYLAEFEALDNELFSAYKILSLTVNQ